RTVLDFIAVRSDLQRVRLAMGGVDVHVPSPDGVKRQVVVMTPHATVMVKGTVFRVEVRKVEGQAVTQVEVSRGSIVVEHARGRDVLAAGDSWSSKSISRTVASTPPTTDLPSPDDGSVQKPPNNPVPVVGAPLSPEKSDLAAQNRL